jgi:hypothetical protein
MKKIIFLFLTVTGCASPKIIYMPFLPPTADSAGRDLFQFYGYEDTLGRWHEWGYPKWKRTLATPPATPFGATDEGPLAPVSFFGKPDTVH